jgi:hypothetical protein
MSRKPKVSALITDETRTLKVEGTKQSSPVKVMSSHLFTIDSNIIDSNAQSANLLLPVLLDRTPIQLQVAAPVSSTETTVTRTKRKYEKKFIKEYKCSECDFLTNSVSALKCVFFSC